MLSACPSPTASKKTLVLASPTAKSQRELIIQTTSPRSNASKQNPLYHIMPSTSTPMGRAKLFKDLASPQHKHSNSHLSFKHLSNSIADIRNLVSMRESTEPNVQSPKMAKHQRVHTISGQEFYIRKPEVVQGEKITEAEKVTKTEGEPIEGAKLTAESPKSGLVMKRGMTLGEADTLAFREEMKKEYENNPLVRVDEEALYYDTIKNLDVCGRCWTNCQKHYTSPFKLKYKGNKCSNYQRDYVPHDPLQKSPTITGDHYEAYHSNHTVSLGSTMRGDYKPWPTNYMKHEGLKPTLGPDNSTFFGKSSYNNDFPGYRTPKGPVERSPQPITVLSELPFEGKSSYRDTFTDSQEPRAFVTRWPKKTAKSPLPTGVPFLGQTTTSDTYKPYKVVGGKGKGDKNNDYQPTKAFMNQFKTIYAKDFDGKGELPCPARVFIDNNPPPRMKHLNTSIKE